MNEGTCPQCGGRMYENTSRGEFGWMSCDTCDYTFNILIEDTKGENNGENT